MKPSAKVILDSVSPNGDRLTTLEVTMHRFVLAEFNTHRVFSRNSASSRAIPVEKQLAKFSESPAFPLEWPREQKGMSGGAELEGENLRSAQALFEDIHDYTANRIQEYLVNHPDKSDRLHKSLINRLFEWGMMHTVIVTADNWEGFYHQRLHHHAQPEIRIAAEAMHEAYTQSSPQKLGYGEWHLPYIDLEDYREADRYVAEFGGQVTDLLRRVSAARCARVSYLTHDGQRAIDKDLELYARLVERAEGSNDPIHWSPLEHVATPARYSEVRAGEVQGNFDNWHQLRHWPTPISEGE